MVTTSAAHLDGRVALLVYSRLCGDLASPGVRPTWLQRGVGGECRSERWEEAALLP